MLRASFLIIIGVALAGCELSPSTDPVVTISFPEAPDEDSVIPFRAGGTFRVTVTGQQSELGRVTRASVELLTSSIPTDAAIAATVTMTDQGDATTLAGTTTLKWPPGLEPNEELMLRVQVGDRPFLDNVPLEILTLTHVEQELSYNGSQLVRTVCFESSASDGTLSLHLAGAKLASGASDGTIALSPGNCSTRAIDPTNPSSSARVEAIVTGTDVQIVASFQGAQVVDVYETVPPENGALSLALSTADDMPPRLSIVELDVLASVDGSLTEDIGVVFQTVPAVTITPSSVTTDATGKAKVRFQMPKEGSLSVIAVSGGVESSPVVFYP